MSRSADIALTALAPAIWGSTYIVTTEFLPPGLPLTAAALRALPAGLLLLPLALLLEPALPPLTAAHVGGFLWLGAVGGAFTYLLWFRGLARLEPASVSALGFLSPLVAVLLGWVFLGQSLGVAQMAGAAIVLASVWVCQRPEKKASPS